MDNFGNPGNFGRWTGNVSEYLFGSNKYSANSVWLEWYVNNWDDFQYCKKFGNIKNARDYNKSIKIKYSKYIPINKTIQETQNVRGRTSGSYKN